MNIEKAKIRLRNEKKLTIVYGIFNNNKNEALDILSILGCCLGSIYATHNVINLQLKMTLICRKCNIEIDDSGEHPEHELMTHYNNLHKKLLVRCMKCIKKTF